MNKIKVEIILKDGATFYEELDAHIVQLMMLSSYITVKNQTISVQFKEVDIVGVVRFYGYKSEPYYQKNS